MLSASDKYRSRLIEQVMISTQRLSKVRNGISLSNALDQQGSQAKQRFLESKKLSSDHATGILGRHSSLVKDIALEETSEPSEILEPAVNSKISQNDKMNKASIRLFPELEQQLTKHSPQETSAKDERLDAILKKVQGLGNQNTSKSVPRLRGLSIESMRKGPSANDFSRDIMTRIWREEHETAMSKLHQLKAQQKLQAIADIEDSERKKTKVTGGDSEQEPTQPSAMIVKNCFKYQPAGILRSETNNSEADGLLRSGSRQYGTILKFKRDVTPECAYPNVKRIAHNLKTYRLGQVAEVAALHDIPNEREGHHKVKENTRDNKCEYVQRSPKRVQIRFVSSSETRADATHRETREAVSLMNKNIASIIPKTKNSVDYSIKVIRENLEFLGKERDITQQKLTMRSKDDQKSTGTDLRINEKRAQYMKWPLASNSQSLNNSVQGSDYIDRQQISYAAKGSKNSMGETSELIKKYEQYESGRNNITPQESSLKNKLEKLSIQNDVGPNNPSYLSKDLTNVSSSNGDLKPKFQRSMSQV